MKRCTATLLLAISIILTACSATLTDYQPESDSEFVIPPVESTPNVSIGFEKDHTFFVNLAVLAEKIDEDYDLFISDEEFKLRSKDLLIRGKKDDYYLVANYRYVYVPENIIVSNNSVFLPSNAVKRIFGVSISSEDDEASLDYSSMDLIKGDSYFYDVTYNPDTVYWLSHIINAESDNQPLAGMIGVGNVVLNRVNSKSYPDTVFEVVFDIQNSRQFDPVSDGTIGRNVYELPMIATYLCLEGYNTVEDSLFFINPIIGVEEGFYGYEFVKTIGDHDFYRISE